LRDYNININELYTLPTTLLNSICEFRQLDKIKFILEAGANPNVADVNDFTPFQSLIMGHSACYTGTDAKDIKNIIELLLEYGAILTLKKWQKTECYDPYIKQDVYYHNLLNKIKKRKREENIFDNNM
jgi:ankyrin repeat protein